MDDPNYYPLLLLKPLQTLSFEFTETVMQNKIQQFYGQNLMKLLGKIIRYMEVVYMIV